MQGIQIHTDLKVQPTDLVQRLRGDTLRQGIGRALNALGAGAVAYARSEFLQGGPSPTRTAVRSGQRRASYGHKLRRVGTNWELDYGPIRASGGVVPVHVRMLEGFDAAGNEFDRMVIRPRKGKYLTFPLRNGGGLAKRNIAGWRRVKQVVFKPRKTFPAIRAKLTREIPEAIGKAFEGEFK